MAQAQFVFETGKPITSVEDFLQEVRAFGGASTAQLYFRGQGEPMNQLVPSIGRKHYFVGRSIAFTPEHERELLVRFRRHAYEHFGRVPTEWETLFLARHHGLPTRLLDWTANPLVALYFSAFYENDEYVYRQGNAEYGTVKLDMDGTVWAIQTCIPEQEQLDVFSQERSPLDIPGIKLVYPFHPSPRIRAQSGTFTLHGDPWTDMVKVAGKSYLDRDLDVRRLKKWTVPSLGKPQIILDLERLAINARTLFPDLDGLARGLWQTEIICDLMKERG